MLEITFRPVNDGLNVGITTDEVGDVRLSIVGEDDSMAVNLTADEACRIAELLRFAAEG